ncbi:hypothetical protein [Sphingorhabdus sp.]|uniref:hypothetical protein n=1 Tax=Sphingorhabdus sp. TaxID=1902408 RepID=UPI0035944BC4
MALLDMLADLLIPWMIGFAGFYEKWMLLTFVRSDRHRHAALWLGNAIAALALYLGIEA